MSDRFTGFNRLAKVELLLFVLLALHTVDHGVNQPARDLPAGAGLIGIGGFVIVAVAIMFALWRSRYAAVAAVIVGGLTVWGFLSIHLIGFGPFADPYADFDANALSWVLLVAPMLAALAVMVAGIAELRGPGVRATAET